MNTAPTYGVFHRINEDVVQLKVEANTKVKAWDPRDVFSESWEVKKPSLQIRRDLIEYAVHISSCCDVCQQLHAVPNWLEIFQLKLQTIHHFEDGIVDLVEAVDDV